MNIEIPSIGKFYQVVSGPFKDFQGECVSYDLDSELPIILQDSQFNAKAVKINEVVPLIKQFSAILDNNKMVIPRTQQN